jgi:AcrR family transcriptional regulator
VYETVSFPFVRREAISMLPNGAPGTLPATDREPRLTRGSAREAAICDAALQLLAEVGYDRMSMDAVAGRAKASKATIYRRWQGKRELVLDAVASRTSHDLDIPDTGSLRGDIIATLRLMYETIGQEDLALMAGVLRAMRSAPELADCVRTSVLEQKRYVGRAIVARAVDRGELPEDSLQFAPDVWHEVAPALMFFRTIVVGGDVDDAFLAHVADDVLVPLLVRCGRRSARQEKK